MALGPSVGVRDRLFGGPGVRSRGGQAPLLDFSRSAEEIRLSQMMPTATSAMPRSFLELILWKKKVSKRIPAVSCPTSRRMVDSITFRRVSVTMEIRKAMIPNNAAQIEPPGGLGVSVEINPKMGGHQKKNQGKNRRHHVVYQGTVVCAENLCAAVINHF